MSDRPESNPVNTRGISDFIAESIDRLLQWVVFEPNLETTWERVRLTVNSFLVDAWRNGELAGATPEEAFFVRCDRTTMNQEEIDAGRLICLVGVAVDKPAEFVVLRIGELTADAHA